MEKKRTIGYQTPSMQIQDEYEKILEQMISKKSNWQKSILLFYESYKDARKMVNDYIKHIDKNKAGFEDTSELGHRIINASVAFMQVIIAMIGKEISECDIRISAIEKEIKELKRAV